MLFCVNRKPICHIFHRFQNEPVSCGRSLRCISDKVRSPRPLKLGNKCIIKEAIKNCEFKAAIAQARSTKFLFHVRNLILRETEFLFDKLSSLYFQN